MTSGRSCGDETVERCPLNEPAPGESFLPPLGAGVPDSPRLGTPPPPWIGVGVGTGSG